MKIITSIEVKLPKPKVLQLEFAFETPKMFSAAEMSERWNRLKQSGRVPPLRDVLKVIERETR